MTDGGRPLVEPTPGVVHTASRVQHSAKCVYPRYRPRTRGRRRLYRPFHVRPAVLRGHQVQSHDRRSILPQTWRNNLQHLADAVSIVQGGHTLKFAGEWTYFQDDYLQTRFARGQFILTGAFTRSSDPGVPSGDPSADSLLGFPRDSCVAFTIRNGRSSFSEARSERTVERFFNTDAFRAPAPFTFGNAGRSIIAGPENALFDLALSRRFLLSESAAIAVRGEVFNIFNHPNFRIPGPYPDLGPFFGRILSTGDPRRFQFAVRFEF